MSIYWANLPRPRHASFAVIAVLTGFLISCSGGLPIPVTGTATNTPAPIISSVDTGNITVNVKDENGQSITDGVVIRVTGTTQADDFDHQEFRIGPCNAGQIIVAWAPGYKSTFTSCDGQSTNYDIPLIHLDTFDNPGYAWVAAGSENDGSSNCAICHAGQRDSSHNEVTEWRKSGHAKVFSNRFLETIYLGTDLYGNKSPDTAWDIIDDHLVQRAPTIDASYRGPGFKLDFPTQNGNCAYCHAPATVGATLTDVNLSSYFPYPGGSIGEGVTCDVCHKVIGVQLDNNGYPYTDRPGILSFQFLRPRDNNLNIGPLTSYTTLNSPNHTSTCSSVFGKSEFCAACHYGKFADTLIYGSYDEWRHSEYGIDPTSASFQSCQDCHMSPSHKPIKDSSTAERQACSAFNIKDQDYDHNMMNYSHDDVTNSEIPMMVKDAAGVNADFKYDPSQKNWLTITAKVRSLNVGHRFPTDSPLRHLILLVEVKDERGTSLSQVGGEKIPLWGGAGDKMLENQQIKFYAGLPGKIFANLLVEEDTNISPTTAYWNETKYAWVGALGDNPYDYSDTRLVPGIVDKSNYSFEVPNRGDIMVTIKLIYRFAFYDLMRQKGWNRPDVLVTSKTWTCKRTENPAGFDCK